MGNLAPCKCGLDTDRYAWFTAIVGRRRDTTTTALIAVAVAVWGAAGYFAMTRQGAPDTAAGDVTSSASAMAAATPPASASAASDNPDTPAGAKPAPIDTTACVASIFAPGTFKTKAPSFAFICQQTNPIRGAVEVKSRIVVAGKGGLTQGMREWAGLNWFEVGGFAVLRAKCCVDPPPYEWPHKPVCPLDQAVEDLGKAVIAGDEAAMKTAGEAYGKHARCIARSPQAQLFNRSSPPGSGLTNLTKFMQRASK